MIKGVLPHQIEMVWGLVSDGIGESCKKGGDKFSAEDIKSLLIDCSMQLWVAPSFELEAFAISEIIKYPRKSIVRLHIGGGNYKEYFHDFIKAIELWGKSHGCEGCEAVTREGYMPMFKENGWKKTQIYVEKEF